MGRLVSEPSEITWKHQVRLPIWTFTADCIGIGIIEKHKSLLKDTLKTQVKEMQIGIEKNERFVFLSLSCRASSMAD